MHAHIYERYICNGSMIDSLAEFMQKILQRQTAQRELAGTLYRKSIRTYTAGLRHHWIKTLQAPTISMSFLDNIPEILLTRLLIDYPN